MEIEIRKVRSRREFSDFLKLPARIHQDQPNWVPPIYMDQRTFFNPKKNPSFRNCDYLQLLAYRNNQAVGRIMGLIPRKYNLLKNENNARFSYLETYDDQEVAHLLLQSVETWAIKLGAGKMVGPLGFSDKEPQGYLVEGFDEPIAFECYANFKYQVDLLEKEGYQPEVNLVVYKADVPEETPPVYNRILPRIEHHNGDFNLIEFNNLLKIRPYIRPILTLTNRAFRFIYASVPYEQHEMDTFANRFIIFLNPRLIKVIENHKKELVAYLIAIPDFTEGLKKCKGHLLPTGLLTVLRSGKKSDRMIMVLGAIDEPYRGRGLDVMMAVKLFESARKAGKKIIDSHLVLEDNLAMCREYEQIGGKVYKRYRIYAKKLGNHSF